MGRLSALLMILVSNNAVETRWIRTRQKLHFRGEDRQVLFRGVSGSMGERDVHKLCILRIAL